MNARDNEERDEQTELDLETEFGLSPEEVQETIECARLMGMTLSQYVENAIEARLAIDRMRLLLGIDYLEDRSDVN
jgi:hypothetical protein